MKKWVLVCSAMLLSISCLATTAFAVDFWQGPKNHEWDRGSPGTTTQVWDFRTEPVRDGQAAPDQVYNPYATGSNGPYVNIPDDQANDNSWYYETVDCPSPNQIAPCHAMRANSANTGGKTMTFTIPNSPENNPQKWIFLQITDTSMLAASFKFYVPDGAGGSTLVSPHSIYSDVKDWERNDHMWTICEMFALDNNPPSETIEISWPHDTIVEEVIIDTICWNGPVATESQSWSNIKSLFR